MRTVLVTGAGGAGRTTVACGTALRAAAGGARVLLLSADADDLSAPGLSVSRPDSGARFREALGALQERGAGLLDFLGARPMAAEELTELPGASQFALLHALEQAEGYDLVLVDLPPFPEAVRLLALPEQLRRYLLRLLPPERQAARALRPVLAQLAGVPAPAQQLYEAAQDWDARLAGLQAVLAQASALIVLEPGARAARELPGIRAALALHGCALEGVVANRVLPTASQDPWLAALAAEQQSALKTMHDEAELTELPHLGREPRSPEDLTELAFQATGTVGPATPAHVEDRLTEDGVLLWRLPLPGAEREDLGLVRRGDELIIDLGPYRRVLDLPSALRRCTIAGATLQDGELRMRFAPDPALWPQRG